MSTGHVLPSCNFFFLIMKDERLLMLGTALRGAQSDDFANGQGKSLIYEIVRLVRMQGLCSFHNVQLNM